jgi:hypothetical protein
MKIKIVDWAEKQGFTRQRAKQLLPRIKPKPERDKVSGWWMVEENAKVEKP